MLCLRRPTIESADRTIGVTRARGVHTQVLGITLLRGRRYPATFVGNCKTRYDVLFESAIRAQLRDYQRVSMTAEPTRLRSEYLNTQVIASSSGRRLGIVRELFVDVDRREVVVLGLRDSLLSAAGTGVPPRYMYLSEIRKSSDVALVDSEDAIEDLDVDGLSRLIGSEVITEAGEVLGRVRDFQFCVEDGKVSSLIVASLGLPQIPDRVISTYELPVEEIVSSGPDRIIVFEGAEERLSQLTVGILERVGIGKPPWERDEDDPYSTSTVRPENQLGTGMPERPAVPNTARPAATKAPPLQTDAWMDGGDEPELEAIPREEASQPQERYLTAEPPQGELEEDNWGDVPAARYEEPASARNRLDFEPTSPADIDEDVWDDTAASQSGQPLNLPEKSPKVRQPEYEEETGY